MMQRAIEKGLGSRSAGGTGVPVNPFEAARAAVVAIRGRDSLGALQPVFEGVGVHKPKLVRLDDSARAVVGVYLALQP